MAGLDLSTWPRSVRSRPRSPRSERPRIPRRRQPRPSPTSPGNPSRRPAQQAETRTRQGIRSRRTTQAPGRVPLGPRAMRPTGMVAMTASIWRCPLWPAPPSVRITACRVGDGGLCIWRTLQGILHGRSPPIAARGSWAAGSRRSGRCPAQPLRAALTGAGGSSSRPRPTGLRARDRHGHHSCCCFLVGCGRTSRSGRPPAGSGDLEKNDQPVQEGSRRMQRPATFMPCVREPSSPCWASWWQPCWRWRWPA
jgi:hypothetical protein